MLDHDTIVAISTAPGRGGIGIVRLSGPQSRQIATPLLRLRRPLVPGRACVGAVLDSDGAVLDEAVVTCFAAPHSYTTQDVLEIAVHGAPVLLQAIVRACLARGARLAEPGEFTRRALLNGRLDLTQAEAVHDLISAQTLHQAKAASAQLGGALSRSIAPSKALLVSLIAELEAGVDFAEDDLDLLPESEIAARLQQMLPPLRALERSYGHGRIVREGFTLALVGAPNAGKSSLFNALLARERAIVTAQPGTTRDPITDSLALGGIPLHLVDTAGLRDSPAGEAEAIGIERSRQAMADADLVLLVSDGPFDAALLASVQARPHLLVRSKIDLAADAGEAQTGAQTGAQTEAQTGAQTAASIATSARTGQGLQDLRQAILAQLGSAPADSAMLTSLRQHTAVQQAVEALQKAADATRIALPHDLLLLDLYAALGSLDELTGATSQEDVLALIFSRFCIGK